MFLQPGRHWSNLSIPSQCPLASTGAAKQSRKSQTHDLDLIYSRTRNWNLGMSFQQTFGVYHCILSANKNQDISGLIPSSTLRSTMIQWRPPWLVVDDSWGLLVSIFTCQFLTSEWNKHHSCVQKGCWKPQDFNSCQFSVNLHLCHTKNWENQKPYQKMERWYWSFLQAFIFTRFVQVPLSNVIVPANFHFCHPPGGYIQVKIYAGNICRGVGDTKDCKLHFWPLTGCGRGVVAGRPCRQILRAWLSGAVLGRMNTKPWWTNHQKTQGLLSNIRETHLSKIK